MIAAIDKLAKLAEPHLTFENVYFFRNLAADVNQPWDLRTASYRNRVITEKTSWVTESFVDSRRCLSVYNHFCYISLVESSQVHVKLSIASSHHYRMCGFQRTNARICSQLQSWTTRLSDSKTDYNRKSERSSSI